MEHIMQFAVSIDDNAIAKRVEETARVEIVGNLQQLVASKLFTKEIKYGGTSFTGGYANPYQNKLTDFATDLVRDFLESHKDEIIQAAGKELAEKLARTKAGKAALTLAQGNDCP